MPWRLVHADVKGAFKERARLLNRRRTLGLCDNPCEALDISENEGAEVYLRRRMSLELCNGGQRFYKIMKNMILNGQKDNNLSQKSYWFGRDQVHMKIKSILHRKMFVSPLALDSMLGIDYTKLTAKEVAKTTDRTIVIHICSAARLQEVLSLDRLCFAIIKDRCKKHELCRKINF